MSLMEHDSSEVISFFLEQVNVELNQPAKLKKWLLQLANREHCQLLELNYIFCSDDYLYDINSIYLQHDTYTDVITFPYQNPPNIKGDIFISIDRIKENANHFGNNTDTELNRVMAHGLLHLCGYGDKTASEKKLMTQKENEALALLERVV